MQNQNIEFVVQLGLGVILVILFLLGITGMYQIRDSNQSMSNVVQNNHLKVEFAHEMRDSIRLRELGLNKMLAMKDPFERDEELIRFYEYAGIYRNARSKLLKLPMDAKEKEIHVELKKAIIIAQPLNRQAAELIAVESPSALMMETVKAASRQQLILLNLLDQLVEIQYQRAREAVEAGTDKYDRSLYVVIMFGVIVIIGAFFIVRKVSKYVTGKNQELLKKNQQLADASDAALAANKTKSAFLATMSHEIRTPLTAIIGFAEITLLSDQTLQERISATKTIIRSGKHLLKIINDILDLSKIEANKLELEELELSPFEMLADVEAIVKPLADSKGLTLKILYEFPLPKVIVSDPLRLKQIIINLTSNAIKFTDTGHVVIVVKFDKETRRVSFNVIDSGIGMTEAQMAEIFKAFTQADSSTTRKYGGTGLGLSLSKELAQQLGGDITVKSLKNTGSQFELTVNAGDDIDFDYIRGANEIPDLHRYEEQAVITDKSTGNILLAEDNPDNQRLLTHFINKLGLSINIAENGKIASTMASEENYDLIFMDMQMPVLNGIDATKQLRKKGYQKPIVALTANAMKKDKEECLKAGCDDFLTKPIDRKALYRVISKYLQKDTSPDQLKPKIASLLMDEAPDITGLVEKYCVKLPGIYQNIKQLVQEKKWSELNDIIHQLKGTGGGMGFPILTEMAGKIEFQIANEDFQAINKLVFDLGNIVNRIISPTLLDTNTNSTVKLVN